MFCLRKVTEWFFSFHYFFVAVRRAVFNFPPVLCSKRFRVTPLRVFFFFVTLLFVPFVLLSLSRVFVFPVKYIATPYPSPRLVLVHTYTTKHDTLSDCILFSGSSARRLWGAIIYDRIVRRPGPCDVNNSGGRFFPGKIDVLIKGNKRPTSNREGSHPRRQYRVYGNTS